MNLFVSKLDNLAKQFNITQNSLLYRYLEKKTRASGRDSKARRSLGNLYALYVLCDAYNKNQKGGSSFTELMREMKSLPFGSKLQNHPLDNRLNDEFRRSFQVEDNYLPVQDASTGTLKRRKISLFLLSEDGMSPEQASRFTTSAIELYIKEIEEKQNEFLTSIEQAQSKKEILEFIEVSYGQNADARLFEIVSYSILNLYFSQKTISINNVNERFQLFKTGRTNANDGGIDFVLRPIGKFFQVTEVLDFRKYFLDFDKINRFPMSFVVKTEMSPEQTLFIIKENAQKSMPEHLSARYMALFEDIFTVQTLREIVISIAESPEMLFKLKGLIIDNFKLEYGLLD
ncbi:type II restriction endonuclease [Enterobacter bugandensis]|uniref:type II restriction endonuclease n=1 Tax=Enterobacter bugandensis TaxID=881260 RepID=UPI0021D0003E|nr:type II restriction endonuclease [Enterobacter bugandensis]MCU6216514.1 type II restriction endonuclease [Enterobacter bugandensis]